MGRRLCRHPIRVRLGRGRQGRQRRRTLHLRPPPTPTPPPPPRSPTRTPTLLATAANRSLTATLGKGAWANVTKGSQIQALAHLESNTYEKDGETVSGGIIVVVDSVNYLETKAETEARRNANAAAPAPAAAAPADGTVAG